MTRRLPVIGGVVLLAVLAVAAALVVLARRGPDLPASEARAFLDAWAKGDATALDGLAVADSGASADLSRFRDQVGITRSTLELGTLRRQPDVTAPVTAVHQMRGLGEWRVQSFLRLVRRDSRWLIDWTPSAFHPDAQPGDRFERERIRPPRATSSAGGQPLTAIGKVVAIRGPAVEDQGPGRPRHGPPAAGGGGAGPPRTPP